MKRRLKTGIYVPPSSRTAEKHLGIVFSNRIQTLTKKEFLRGWCSLFYLCPGLHPDGFASRGSGWPKRFKPLAADAWRRYEAAEIIDNELYCYQAAKARIAREQDA